ncbi:MAG TPA: CocE/NonD family hydrolase [Gaiellaceae bacterium]|nr:CocE/NonD family hydrolase [Gaiellaceae bacterium]
MGRTRVAVGVVAAAVVCAGAAAAASAVLAGTRAVGPSTQELTITASDGTKLACGLVLPGGSPPTGGWAGVLLFHGLGQSHAFMETIAQAALAPAGLASLACDARGTGASGGTFGLDGPQEVQDARDLFTWLAARNDVSDTQIGAVGLSLGGGEVWNAAVAGVPFKAIVPAIAWTDLGAALNPDGVPKAGEVDQLAKDVPPAQWDSSLAQTRQDLLAGNVTAAVKSTEAARSSRAQLRSLHVPTFILQGRHDFLFDLDQALAAYRLLPGPKRLYLGDLGHPPATNPTLEQPEYLAEVVAWLREYLAGGPKLGSGVQLAHDPFDGTPSFYKGIPRTRHMSVNLPGRTTLTKPATVSRSVRLTGGPLETFGDSSVVVRYSGAQQWGDLVATVAAKGSSTPVTYGAAPVTRKAGVLRIPLSDQAVLLPRGKRIVVTVGGQTADGVYGPPAAGAGSIVIRGLTLNLSLLNRAVSR